MLPIRKSTLFAHLNTPLRNFFAGFLRISGASTSLFLLRKWRRMESSFFRCLNAPASQLPEKAIIILIHPPPPPSARTISWRGETAIKSACVELSAAAAVPTQGKKCPGNQIPSLLPPLPHGFNKRAAQIPTSFHPPRVFVSLRVGGRKKDWIRGHF